VGPYQGRQNCNAALAEIQRAREWKPGHRARRINVEALSVFLPGWDAQPRGPRPMRIEMHGKSA